MGRLADKQELIDELVTKLVEERDTLANDIRAQAVDVSKQSSAMQSRYDSFREEGQYKIAALSRRIADLDGQITMSKLFSPVTRRTDKAQGGSLVHLIAEDGREAHYLLVPFTPGVNVQFNEYTVTVVTPSSEVGQRLLGATHGKMINVGDTTYTVRGIE